MNNSLQRIERDEWLVLTEQATMLVKSGFLPPSIKSPENAVAIILMGRELSIGPMASLQSINIIQNKPTVSPQLMLALINRSGQLEDYKVEFSGSGATVTMKRRGRSAYTTTFGAAEASALQLAGKDNYKKQPATMYQWRAVAAAARVVFPDVILGLYTPDEMGVDVDEETGEALSNLEPRAPQTIPPARLDTPAAVMPHLETIRSLPSDEQHNELTKTAIALAEELGRTGEQLHAWICKEYEVTDGLDSLSISYKEALIARLIKMLKAQEKSIAAVAPATQEEEAERVAIAEEAVGVGAA